MAHAHGSTLDSILSILSSFLPERKGYLNGANQTEDDINGSEFPSGPISEEVFLPVGTNEAVSVVAVDPNGLFSTGNPTFTGTFVADC